jgi:hypothetical protein
VLLAFFSAGLAAAPAQAAGHDGLQRRPGTPLVVRRGDAPVVQRHTAALRTANVAAAPLSTWSVTYHGFTAQAQASFAAAVDTWSRIVKSAVPIKVEATFEDLSSAGPDVLGAAGPDYEISGPGIGNGTSYYADALADSLNGTDNDPGFVDIDASFNSVAPQIYYGTDGNPPLGYIDFESVVLHELGHGLGFSGSSGYSGGTGTFDCLEPATFACPAAGYEIYDTYLQTAAGSSLTDLPNNSTDLGSAYTATNGVWWGGPNGTVANGGSRIKLYAPGSWSDGSSIAHMDEDSYSGPNALMTPYLNNDEVIHAPGPLVLALMRDTGWVTAYDAAKVTGVTAAPYDKEVTLSWTAASGNGYPVTAYRVSWTHNGVVQAPQTTTATSLDLPGLVNGDSYGFTVSAVNAVGYGPTSDVVTASPVPDTTPPTVSFAASPSYRQQTGSMPFTATDPGHPTEALTYQCGLDSPTLTSCANPAAFANLALGAHTLYVTATDTACNASQVASFPFTVETTPPTVQIDSGPSGWVHSATFAFSGTDESSAVTFQCSLDSGPATACTSPATYAGLTHGTHSFSVNAVDVAGNTNTVSQPFQFQYDALAPVTSSAALPAYNLNSAVGLRYSATDAGSGVASYDVRYRKAPFNGGFGAYSNPVSTTALLWTTPAAPGWTYCLQARAHDKVGLVSAWSTERCTVTPLDDRAFAASSGWGRGSGSPYYKGTVTATTKTGQVLTRTGAQARRLYLVVTTCHGCGTLGVYWNSRLMYQVNLNAASTTVKRVVRLPDFGSVWTGTLQLKALNSGRTYVDGVALSRF